MNKEFHFGSQLDTCYIHVTNSQDMYLCNNLKAIFNLCGRHKGDFYLLFRHLLFI